MKSILLLPAALFSLLLSNQGFAAVKNVLTTDNDSSIIHHKLDGKTEEWPLAKFTSDKETEIQYAIDNDGTNLFLALNIPNPRIQFKVMRNGMTFYLDLKGKKKESNGVQFPVKNGEADLNMPKGNRQNGGQSADGEQKKPDIKMIRKMLALNMVQLKVFGLSDQYPDGQQLLIPGSVNVAFSFDSADVMHIEYILPLSMIGDKTTLDNHEASFGWKVLAFERPKPADDGGSQAGNPQRYGSYEQQSIMEDQKFWTKYTFHLPTEKKGF